MPSKLFVFTEKAKQTVEDTISESPTKTSSTILLEQMKKKIKKQNLEKIESEDDENSLFGEENDISEEENEVPPIFDDKGTSLNISFVHREFRCYARAF